MTWILGVVLLVIFAAVVAVSVGLSLDEARGFSFRLTRRDGQPAKEASIVWPAVGFPAQLSRDTGRFTVLVDVVDDVDPKAVRASLRAVAAPEAAPTLLVLVRATQGRVTDYDVGGVWHGWMARRHPRVHELVFEVRDSSLGVSDRTRLFDLAIELGSRSLVAAGAVFIPRAQGALRIATATDTHVARRWAEIRSEARSLLESRPHRTGRAIADVLEREAGDGLTIECFEDSFVDPNHNLAAFIETVNVAWDAGELDAVLLSGDLVDYKFESVRGQEPRSWESSAWSLFDAILSGRAGDGARLKAPLFTAVGNHDYRLRPYKLRIYGIRHAGIPDALTEFLRVSRGRRSPPKYELSDLDALRINTGATHSLEYYFERINPFAAYAARIGDVPVVALDSGPDFYCDAGLLLGRRWRRFIWALTHPKGGPRSAGFDDAQLRLLQRTLEEAGSLPRPPGVIVMSHAPLVNPVDMPSIENGAAALGTAPSGCRERSPAVDLEFEEWLGHAQLDAGGVFRGHARALRLLQGYRGRSLVLSGHTHWNIEIALDRKTGELMAGDLTGRDQVSDWLNDHVVLVQTASLGHVKRSVTAHGFPAYRIIEAEGDQLRDAGLRELGEPPFRHGFEDWQEYSAGDTVRVMFNFHRAARAPDARLVRVVVCQVLSAEPHAIDRELEHMRLTVTPEPPTSHVVDRRLPHQGGYIAIAAAASAEIVLELTGKPRSARIGFVFETLRIEDSGTLTTLSVRRHHRTLT